MQANKTAIRILTVPKTIYVDTFIIMCKLTHKYTQLLFMPKSSFSLEVRVHSVNFYKT